MDIVTIAGVALGFISVIGAMIFKHLSFGVLVNPAAFFVIIVGTVATVLNSFTGSELKNLGKLFGVIFKNDTKLMGAGNLIEEISTLAISVRKEGLLALEPKIETMPNPFMKKAFGMLIDGATEDYIFDVLSAEVEATEERHALNASIFSSAGAYAPTLGVLGAVFGLIAAMQHIDNTDAMAEAIAAAFVATILGIFTGYVLWNPFATKLKTKSKHEMLEKRIIIEGVLSIHNSESPVMIKEKLLAFLPVTQQAAILAAAEKSKAEIGTGE